MNIKLTPILTRKNYLTGGESVIFDSSHTITTTGNFSHFSKNRPSQCFVDYVSYDTGQVTRALLPARDVYLVPMRLPKEKRATDLPKLKINRFKEVLDKKTVDTFTVELIEGAPLTLDIKEDGTAIIHSTFQVYGWGHKLDVLAYRGNSCIYTSSELYEIMRGRSI